ncbi:MULTISPECIES: hypothetical protein [Rhizobium]|uniref:Uncharacterized protein n=1 Tax=Rhizobium binae TaxID=1138190 RepID=A0ABV2MQ98_9HYPH|nr:MULTISPECIES: hypothetical protein [Rhizobium]NKL52508.1 hypothetical protein [Rhizobium leguminosarum bv. viciae]MBX4939173.1 hypothetical protein [Rhizobium binae]MBX4945694.1 hypothetical protein [Rhizobium binae]MBX4981533.1 hypothetical protein [Rhizobium binae]MBX4995720.1 hypothetical protein [Rhizobium binae]
MFAADLCCIEIAIGMTGTYVVDRDKGRCIADVWLISALRRISATDWRSFLLAEGEPTPDRGARCGNCLAMPSLKENSIRHERPFDGAGSLLARQLFGC